jgi:hypothetical protein
MRPALDPAGHRVPRTKPTCLLHCGRPHRQRPFALVLHLHQHESSRNLHLQYLAKYQSTQHCQSLITQGSEHPSVLEPHMVLRSAVMYLQKTNLSCQHVTKASTYITVHYRNDIHVLSRCMDSVQPRTPFIWMECILASHDRHAECTRMEHVVTHNS